MRRKKNKRETKKLLRANTRDKLALICTLLKKTVRYYRGLYFESDHYRMMKLTDITKGTVAEDGYTGGVVETRTEGMMKTMLKTLLE